MASILGDINDFITSIIIIIVLLVFFYGQNFQGWYAGRQLKKALKELDKSKRFGIGLITKTIEPFRSETLSNEEIASFIQEMLDFFVLSPSDLDVSKYPTLNFLHSRQESRYKELILNFIPAVDDNSLVKITSLLTITAEIDDLYKKVRHNLITGEKTKSYWYLLQSAADISTTMLTAQAYRHALTSFIGTQPIGDSVGPLTIQKFVEETNQEGKTLNSSIHEGGQFYSQKVDYQDRQCICLRVKGPESRVGNPGIAIQQLFAKFERSEQKVGLFISVDAVARREGEKSGTVAHGLGVATGNGRYPQKNTNVDKFQIEKLIMQQIPPVPNEAIVCRVSFEEAFLPITETIQSAVPKILRFIKQIIRSQTKPGETVVIIGIGNAIGIPL
ncbi:MAG: DUF1512 family protein [Promethearchaeota archaeon]